MCGDKYSRATLRFARGGSIFCVVYESVFVLVCALGVFVRKETANAQCIHPVKPHPCPQPPASVLLSRGVRQLNMHTPLEYITIMNTSINCPVRFPHTHTHTDTDYCVSTAVRTTKKSGVLHTKYACTFRMRVRQRMIIDSAIYNWKLILIKAIINKRICIINTESVFERTHAPGFCAASLRGDITIKSECV